MSEFNLKMAARTEERKEEILSKVSIFNCCIGFEPLLHVHIPVSNE